MKHIQLFEQFVNENELAKSQEAADQLKDYKKITFDKQPFDQNGFPSAGLLTSKDSISKAATWIQLDGECEILSIEPLDPSLFKIAKKFTKDGIARMEVKSLQNKFPHTQVVCASAEWFEKNAKLS